MFPFCNHAGRVLNAQKRFCREPSIGNNRPVTLQTCQACPLASREPCGLVPICDPPAALGQTCIHRREQVSSVGCPTCGGGTAQIPVFACKLHEDCTIDRDAGGGTACCRTCKDKTPVAKAEFSPLTGPANLMWFVYPRKATRDVWTAQQEMIRNALKRFDGRKLLAIAVDDSTDQDAIELDGWDEAFEFPNDPDQWELPGWRWAMLRLMYADGFTVRLHAKGAVRGVNEPHLEAWWKLAYESLLDVAKVRRSLESAVITGPFRLNKPATNLKVPWIYAGSFYAFRNSEVFSRPWDMPPACPADHHVEAWPARVARREESACLAFDGVRGDLYSAKAWKGQPQPAEQLTAISTSVDSQKNSTNSTKSPTSDTTEALSRHAPHSPVVRVPRPLSPAVSIVVPAWNESRRIEKCLRAIQEQTFADFECFVVDDGSTDGAAEVIWRTIRFDERFVYVRKPHGGIGDTLNRGFALCKAPLLTWASADSWMYPQWLESLKSALDANPDHVMAYSDWDHFDEATGKTTTVREPEFDRKDLQARCRMGVCWMFRAEAKAKAGPYVNDPAEDYYMHLRLSEFGDFVHVPKTLGAWRNHKANTSNRICNPSRWACNTIVKGKARWQQAKHRVAYLCPNLDAASVGWLHVNAVNDLSDDFAARHILGDTTHVTPGVDARLYNPGGKILTDEARKILAEADIVHVNNQFPDFDKESVSPLIEGKPLVLHMHGGRWQWDSEELRKWKDRGAAVLTCTPGHHVATWIPNIMPTGDERISYAGFYLPAARNNRKLRLLCHHNYPGGKGVDQIADVLDGIDEVVFGRKLKAQVEWSLATDKKLSLFDHLELKRGFDLTIDTLTHGFCGMATWEAMAMAQAVVCRMDEKTLADYRRVFGSVPPIGNPRTVDDVADILTPLFRDRGAVRAAAEANRRWILEHYTAAKILPLYEDIYRSVLK